MYRYVLVAVFWLASALMTVAQAPDDGAIVIDWSPDTVVVSGVVEIRGTVNPLGLFQHFVEVAPYAPEPGDPQLWAPISLLNATPIVDDSLAEWDTMAFADGPYMVRIHTLLETAESVLYTIGPITVSNQGAAAVAETVDILERPREGITADPAFAPLVIVPSPIVTNDLPLSVGGHVVYFSEDTQALMRDTGLTWVKWQLRFRLGDDTLGARDLINRSHDAGFKVILSVTGEVDELRDLGEDYYPLFAEFLGEAAALGPDALEIWNEMNIDREWPRGRINPQSYAALLRPAYEAIKAANPDTMVITGALAPTGAEGAFGADRVWNDDNYYRGMVSAGVTEISDCIGVHYNEGIVAPRQEGGDPRGGYPTRYLPLMLERVGFPFRNGDTALCFTELGYLTPEGYGPLPGAFAWAGSTSVEEQATWLAEAIAILADYERVPVRMMIIWNVDFDIYGSDPQGGYAIIRPDGDCPACETIGAQRAGS